MPPRYLTVACRCECVRQLEAIRKAFHREAGHWSPLIMAVTEVNYTLEGVKLAVGALTPIAVTVLGWWITRHLKRIEQLQWANQKAVDKRMRYIQS